MVVRGAIRTGQQPVPIGLSDLTIPAQNEIRRGGVEFAAMELFLAWWFYRKGGREARGAAAFGGLFLIAGLFVLLGSVAPGDVVGTIPLLGMAYTIGSHLLYAAAGSSRRLR